MRLNPQKMKKITVVLKERLVNKLNDVCDETEDINRSELIQQFCEYGLDNIDKYYQNMKMMRRRIKMTMTIRMIITKKMTMIKMTMRSKTIMTITRTMIRKTMTVKMIVMILRMMTIRTIRVNE